MANSWKSFDFFDVDQARPGDDEARSVFEGNEIASVCSGSDSLFLGSFDGHVRIVGPRWTVVRSFRAHDTGSITHMRQVEGTSFLVTVAEDLRHEPVLKVWALDRPERKTGLPTCLSTIAISNGHKPFPISAFTATADLSQLAAGFANGAVALIRGDLINDTGTRQRIVHESEEPVTGLAIHVDAHFDTTLTVATTARILSIRLAAAAKGKAQAPKTVEDVGCAVGCMAVDARTDDVVVARDDALYYYGPDGRGPPRAYDGPKSLVAVYGDYVAVVSPASPISSQKSPKKTSKNGDRRLGASVAATADALFSTSTLVLLEPDLHVVAHTETLLSAVKAVFTLWGALCVLTLDGKVRLLREKALSERLSLLYGRNLYHLAIELARKAGLDAAQQNAIFRRFGDYLYAKGSFDEAMVQYIKAIDQTEPSQVIRKFLDTQRIHNLIGYLEELHEQHRATADHTTLLLNCYAKLKDLAKLEAFIKQPGALRFDLDTAIGMCRQGGYYEQAVYLAKQHGEHALVVDILVADAQQYADALDYIWHLAPDAAFVALQKYARVLIEHCPEDTTRLFVEYYAGRYTPRRDVPTAGADVDANGTSAGGFAYGAVSGLAGLISLPYYGTSTSASTSAPTLAPTLTPTPDTADTNADKNAAAKLYDLPRPRTAFSAFIDHTDEFIVFLESLLAAATDAGLSESDRTDLHTTLFEMYLQKAAEDRGDEHREQWEAKAKSLIAQKADQGGAIERANVLLLSHLRDFRAGTTLVKEQAGLVFDIFRSYTAAKDTRGALKALAKYGPDEPRLYPAALAYLTSSVRVIHEAGPAAIQGVLDRIHADALLSPLQVVQTLSQSGVATMGLLKPYLRETVAREQAEIAANARRADMFRAETAQRRAELADLTAKPAVVQATRCSQCALALELPAVHFLCRHSFHQRCLASVEAECPLCAPDNATVRAIRQQQEEYATRHDLFAAELADSDDRFGTVADWFQRGIMGG